MGEPMCRAVALTPGIMTGITGYILYKMRCEQSREQAAATIDQVEVVTRLARDQDRSGIRQDEMLPARGKPADLPVKNAIKQTDLYRRDCQAAGRAASSSEPSVHAPDNIRELSFTPSESEESGKRHIATV